MTTKENTVKKPIQLRIIFILNALMIILPFIFYFVITNQNILIGGLEPIWMVYTGIAYLASFILLVVSIFKRNIVLLRGVLIANILIAIPAKAIIGIVVAIISILISFHKNIKAFFASTGKIGF